MSNLVIHDDPSDYNTIVREGLNAYLAVAYPTNEALFKMPPGAWWDQEQGVQYFRLNAFLAHLNDVHKVTFDRKRVRVSLMQEVGAVETRAKHKGKQIRVWRVVAVDGVQLPEDEGADAADEGGGYWCTIKPVKADGGELTSYERDMWGVFSDYFHAIDRIWDHGDNSVRVTPDVNSVRLDPLSFDTSDDFIRAAYDALDEYMIAEIYRIQKRYRKPSTLGDMREFDLEAHTAVCYDPYMMVRREWGGKNARVWVSKCDREDWQLVGRKGDRGDKNGLLSPEGVTKAILHVVTKLSPGAGDKTGFEGDKGDTLALPAPA